MLRLCHSLLCVALVLIAAATSIKLWRVAAVQRGEAVVLEQSIYLSDLDWNRATTGWVAIANDGLPARDRSFTGLPLRIGGQTYAKGLGTYPVSEIVYLLDGEYQEFESVVGLDDQVPPGSGGVEFLLFVDEVLAYRSGTMRGGDAPKRVSESVADAQRLRLVVSDECDGDVANWANWGDARLTRRVGADKDSEPAPSGRNPRASAVQADSAAQSEAARLDSSAQAGVLYLESVSPQSAGEISYGYVPSSRELYLSNGKIAVAIGYGGPTHGALTVYHLPSRRYVAYQVSPSLKLPSGSEVHLVGDTSIAEPGYEFFTVNDEALGKGRQLLVRFSSSHGTIAQRVSLFGGSSSFVMQMSVDGLDEVDGEVRFRLLDLKSGGLFLGGGAEYLTDYSRPRHGYVLGDGVLRREAVGAGKPVFIWDEDYPQAIILATLDETKASTTFSIVRGPDTALAKVRFESSEISGSARPTRDSPRLYVEITDSNDPRTAFSQFKSLLGSISPPPSLPSWVKYQWLSWYVYYMDINEDVIRRQIDYIADNLADLGTWSILIDAGWYVSEGREGAGWRSVDRDKFPSGLRNLVDYAHSRGQKVVLYFSTPYVDTRTRRGDWLGLGALVREHPDWFTLLGEDEERKSYALDYSNPDAREYVRSVLRDFFLEYDVDGIKIDGLGNADGALLDADRLDPFGVVDRVAGQTLDIYRFIYENATSLKGDVYIESGWLTPSLANRYAHTFRYGDEHPGYSNAYPFPGLLEHVDYALLQKMAFGQRPNMGAVYGDPNPSSVSRWWLQAGLALGTQVVLSFDLPSMTLETLSQYRSILAHYDAFEGATVYDRLLGPNYFATTVGPVTYLGILGREEESKSLRVALHEIGVIDDDVVAYDVSASRFFKPRGSIRTVAHPGSFKLYVIRSAPGVVWSNSSLHGERTTDSSYQVEVKGPKAIDGFAHIFSPPPKGVYIDGRDLRPSLISLPDAEHYVYDVRRGIVTLSYAHDRPHIIRIDY